MNPLIADSLRREVRASLMQAFGSGNDGKSSVLRSEARRLRLSHRSTERRVSRH